MPWIDENLNPSTGDWISRTRLKAWKNGTWDAGKGGVERGKDYNHSTYLRSGHQRADRLASAGGRHRRGQSAGAARLGRSSALTGSPITADLLTILWDRTGQRYQQGKGLARVCRGREIAAAANLGRITGPLPNIPAPRKP